MTFTNQFPILKTCTYLNTAYSGILSEPLLNWRRTHDLNFFEHGSTFRLHQAEFLQEVKVALASFFKAEAARTFLVPNFSFGFNTFLGGLNASHRFLLLQEDYPSVNFAVTGRGFANECLPVNTHLEENILAKIKVFKPTVFAFSLVQYINGIKFDAVFLKKIKEQFPDLLIVADGTQFCGTERFDFEQSGLDVLIASGYKWMLGGYGNGFVFLKEEVASRLYQSGQQIAHPKEPFLKDKSLLSLYFEPGHQDTLAFGSLLQSVLMLENIGQDVIESNIKELTDQAKKAFTERGLLHPVVAERQNHSSIFNLNLPEKIYRKLTEAGIGCTFRGAGIRVSFHFYNTAQNLAHLLKVIDQNR